MRYVFVMYLWISCCEIFASYWIQKWTMGKINFYIPKQLIQFFILFLMCIKYKISCKKCSTVRSSQNYKISLLFFNMLSRGDGKGFFPTFPQFFFYKSWETKKSWNLGRTIKSPIVPIKCMTITSIHWQSIIIYYNLKHCEYLS